VEALDDMVVIPGGSFIMGDNLPERPQHTVTVDGFWLDRFEVTNLQYQQYLQETGAASPEGWNGVCHTASFCGAVRKAAHRV
jgi:formylglycine-generating enzyme required for sulfatase activity